MLKTMQEYWDPAFNQYYLKHIHTEIDLIARYHLSYVNETRRNRLLLYLFI